MFVDVDREKNLKALSLECKVDEMHCPRPSSRSPTQSTNTNLKNTPEKVKKKKKSNPNGYFSELH